MKKDAGKPSFNRPWCSRAPLMSAVSARGHLVHPTVAERGAATPGENAGEEATLMRAPSSSSIAAIAALPFRPVLFHGTEAVLRLAFLLSNASLALGLVLRVFPAAADAEGWARWLELPYRVVVPLFALQLVLYGLMLLLFFRPGLAALPAFGVSLANWGPGQSAAPGLLPCRRDYAAPARYGLPHARVVHIRTRDGETLGAWHVLPAGREARRASAKVAAGGGIDDIFDESLARASRAVLYLHGMGETRCAEMRSPRLDLRDRGLHSISASLTDDGGRFFPLYTSFRCKWVPTEHAKMLSAHLDCHVLLLDYRGFGDSTGAPSSRSQCT